MKNMIQLFLCAFLISTFSLQAQTIECSAFIFPEDQASDLNPDVDLEWEAVDGAIGYTVYLGTSSGTSDVVNDVSEFNFYDLPSLDPNTIYYLRIIPFDANGPAENCNETNFSIGGGTTPECTDFINPEVGSTDVSINTGLEWEPTVNAWGYFVSVGTTSGGTDIVNEEDIDVGNLLDLPTLEYNTTYFVLLNPYNEFGFAAGCQEITFTTEQEPGPPSCITNISPADGAINVSPTADIFWTAVPAATGYRITVGTTPGGNDFINNEDLGNTTLWTPTALTLSTTYYVSVNPYNQFGSMANCAETSFTTLGSVFNLDCTSLTSPLNGDIGVNINNVITWSVVPNANGYFVSIGTNPEANNLLENFDNGALNSLSSGALVPNTTYYIVVTPYDDETAATNCTIESFTTAEDIQTIVCTSLSSPTNGAIDVPINSTIDWNAVAGATGYKLSVGSIAGVSDFINSLDVGNVTTYSLGTLGYSFQYFIKVVPYNENGDAVDCVEENFTTEAQQTDVSILCPGDETYTVLVGLNSRVVLWEEPTGTTTCPTGTITINQISGPSNGSELMVGDVAEIIYEITDECDNTSTCSFSVTVLGTSLVYDWDCPENIILNSASENGLVVNYEIPTPMHNCNNNPTVAQVAGLASGDLFPIGTTLIEYESILDCNGVTYTETCEFVITVKFSPDTSDCPDEIQGFTVLGEFNGHKYYLSNNADNWTNASANAALNNAYLVSINDADENEFIRSNLGNTIAYIGLTDADVEGNYQWDSGEAFTYNFIETQPISGDQDFASINFWSGGWAFDNQFVQRRYIIETSCGPVPTELFVDCPQNLSVNIPLDQNTAVVNYELPTFTASCSSGEDVSVTLISGPESGSVFNVGETEVVYDIVLTCGDEMLTQQCTFTVTVSQVEINCTEEITGFTFLGTYNDHNYFLSNNSESWTSASATAAQNDGYLVSMNDAAENEFVRSVIGNNIVYIGLTDENSEGNYQWDSDESFTYNFIETQPTSGDADYANMNFWSGGWSFDINFVQRRFVMEVECGPSGPSMNVNCPGDQSYQAAPGATSAPVNWTEPTATTTCDGGGIMVTQISGPQQSAVFQVGQTETVTYVIDDGCGNESTCSFTVTLNGVGTTDCPDSIDGFEFLGERAGHKYFRSTQPTVWTAAQQIAADNGGYLVSINDADENEFIKNNINEITMIGFSDVASEGNFVWDSGETIDYNFLEVPNNNEGDFGVINFWNGGWLLTNQYAQKQYIIELNCAPSGPSLSVLCIDDIIMTAGVDVPAMAINWELPVALTTCLEGMVSVEQTAGPISGAVFELGQTELITYVFTDECGNSSVCSFNVGLVAENTGECPDEVTGYSFMGEYGGHHYFLSNSPKIWSDAQAEAASLGGYLVSITSQEENDFLQSNISDIVMTGLTDQNSEGVFEWDSGEAVDFSFITDGNAGDADFGTINFWNGGWGTVNQFVQKTYIVEFSCDGTPPQSLSREVSDKLTIQNLYPNPTTNYITIEIESSVESATAIKVIDALGMTKIELPIQLRAGISKIEVNVNELKEGLYFIQLSGHESNAAHTKFLKFNSDFKF